MASIGGPNLQTDNLIIHLDSANIKSYVPNQLIWNDLSGFGNSFILNNITNDSTDSTLVMASLNSKLSGSITVNNISNITLVLAIKLKQLLNQIQTLTKTNVSVTGLNQTTSKFNIFCKTFSKNTNTVVEKTYLNGEQLNETTYTDSILFNSSNLKINVNTSGKTGFAKIQTLLIYNKVLTATEIQQNYNAMRGRFGI